MATRKLLGKVIAQARASHTGRDGDLFFDDSSNQFFISDGSTAGGVPLALNNLVNVVAVTDATLAPTVAQSGSIFSITAAAGCVVTLPAASAGLNYSFHLAATVTSGSVALTWTAGDATEDSYDVQRKSSATGTYTSIGLPTTESYTDTTGVATTTYWYRVFAKNTNGTSIGSNVISVVAQ